MHPPDREPPTGDRGSWWVVFPDQKLTGLTYASSNGDPGHPENASRLWTRGQAKFGSVGEPVAERLGRFRKPIELHIISAAEGGRGGVPYHYHWKALA